MSLASRPTTLSVASTTHRFSAKLRPALLKRLGASPTRYLLTPPAHNRPRTEKVETHNVPAGPIRLKGTFQVCVRGQYQPCRHLCLNPGIREFCTYLNWHRHPSQRVPSPAGAISSPARKGQPRKMADVVGATTTSNRL
jgi:hypothetical protein